ncbi:hypothetical protein C8J56DRAFT_1031543 [Mycena floridula]|nr:hypothetical protein C8J56DRAFT_1031543 [Mycena floridula]
MNQTRKTEFTSIQRLVDQLFVVIRHHEALDKIALDELDLIEQRIQKAAASLRGYRNSRLLINRVPPEIMTEIFSLVQPSSPSFAPWWSARHYSGDPKEYTHQWMGLLEVCRRWRGIVATSPKLWSSIVRPSDIECYLRRSGSALLSLDLLAEEPQALSISTLNSLALHRGRIAQLHFSISDHPAYINHRFLTRSVPELFSLSAYSEHPGDTVLPQLFGGRMPKLKQLSLRHFAVWPTGYFHNLTHLALYDQPFDTRPSTSTFLDFIANSPLLEVIILGEAGPTKEDQVDLPPVADGRIISLAALKELNLGPGFPAFATARLLSHLSLPAGNETYIISGIPLLGFNDDLASFLPPDISELQNLSNIKECIISRTSTELTGTPMYPQHIAVSQGRIQLHALFSPTQFTPFYDRYPLINICKLSVHDASRDTDGSSVISSHQWKELFIHTPALETLNIFRMSGSTPVTSRILTALETDSDKSFLCPLLQYLRIDDEFEIPTLRLFNMVKGRAEGGRPLLRLIISYTTQPQSMENVYLSSFNEEDAKMFEAQVKEVVFQPWETSTVDPIFYPGFGSAHLQYVKHLWNIPRPG